MASMQTSTTDVSTLDDHPWQGQPEYWRLKATSECKHVLSCARSRGPSWAGTVFRCSVGHERINWYALHMLACDQMNQWQLLCRPMPDLPAPLRDGALSETDYRVYSDRMKPHVDKALGMLLDTLIPLIGSPSMMSTAKVLCTSSLFCTVALCVGLSGSSWCELSWLADQNWLHAGKKL
jgi:hypothetical protein